MIRPAKSPEAREEFRREPSPNRHAERRLWQLNAVDFGHDAEPETDARTPFANFRPRWWTGHKIPL